MTTHRARSLAAATFAAVFGIAAGLINLSWWALGLGALAGGYVLAVAVEDQEAPPQPENYPPDTQET